MFVKHSKLLLLGGAALAGLAGTAAQAAGTVAGTPINNTASVSFSVGGGTQTATSTTATFLVDRKVNLAVDEVGGTPTQTAQGATDQVTTFTVTNLTNAIQDFRLDPNQQAISVPIPAFGIDDFDVTSVRAFVDVNRNGTYESAIDTKTFIDELAPDATVTVFIVANVPNVANQHVAIVSLNAVAAAGGTTGSLGADLVATSLLTPDSPTTIDIVFADGLSDLDLPRNGQMRAFDAYQISTAAVAIAKTARVVSDPVNLLVNPHAIPGATMEYCLAITNAGPADATAVAITDALPANTTYVANSMVVGPPGVGPICVLPVTGTSEDDNATGPDETDLYGGSFDGTNIKATIPTITPLIPISVSFRVTLN